MGGEWQKAKFKFARVFMLFTNFTNFAQLLYDKK